ncbi:alpha/beta hydrolase [Nesterenkonia alkaliphila]|uniref:Alpha/beta fold hydrolase n=1 Tax=Nesterenkonia alkaliphila TaxID=1463631 RepID=A0A7K1UID9_9MICC|nr:alpha/beta fold hydrolase [Nesterenkonia alkaliphila]MVT26142.1 alpha/beta fold hydrolase [Nesterenkonia alkaliphila]GFZ84086.1 carboxylesterase [Nesterenkonia alkaliphila]
MSHNRSTGVLVLHGFTSTTASMQPVAEAAAAAGYETELPLLPGHGSRWEDLAETRAEAILEAVSTAYDRLSQRCGTIVTVGLSMGGALALWAAAEKNAAGVVVINPGLRLAAGTGLLARGLHRFRPTIPAIAGEIAKPDVTEDAYEVTPVRAVVQLDRLFRRARAALPQLSQRNTPVLLLRSPIDKVVGSASATLLKRRVPQTREVILRRSRHVATLDHDAELVNRRTVEFIAACSQ